MKKLIATNLLLYCLATIVIAQTGRNELRGQVLERENNQPAMQATVRLLNAADSTYLTGTASDEAGTFAFHGLQTGRYLLHISSIGFKAVFLPLTLKETEGRMVLPPVMLETEAIMLAETVITAQAAEVEQVEDTLMYNAAAFRTPEGAMLEELVKKLPGAEIDENGVVKINGKEIKKIMVDGKEFFGGDVAIGLQNLPVSMIDKIKAYDRQSDMARVSGIDDGEEETVLDLKIKKEMKRGWFGNQEAAAGSEKRYAANLSVNRFVGKTQFTLLGNANNVNNRRYSGGRGGRRGGNGLTAVRTTGANFATKQEKIELTGNVRYNRNATDLITTNASERFLSAKSSFSNSNNIQSTSKGDFNAEIKLEWKPDSMTSIIFQPKFTLGNSDGRGSNLSGTFNDDPYPLDDNPNAWLNLDLPENMADPLAAIRVNGSNGHSLSEADNHSLNGSLQIGRRMKKKGRSITLRGSYGFSRNENLRFSTSKTHYYNKNSDDNRKRHNHTEGNSHDYAIRLTYSEPIAKAVYLQMSYQFQYRYTENNRSAYDLFANPDLEQEWMWEIGDALPDGYLQNLIEKDSKYAEYEYFNHNISTNVRINRKKCNMSIGFNLLPQNTRLNYKKGDIDEVVKRTVFNYSPNINIRYRFSKRSDLRLTYRGKGSQPNMENMLEITDDSNPLRIRKGNAGLKPSFSHNIRLQYQGNKPASRRGINAYINYSVTQNSFSNSTEYDESTGGVTITPQNINGNWNASAGVGFNTALSDRRFNIHTNSDVRYNNRVSYLYNKTLTLDEKNTSTETSLSERVNCSFRNDWLEVSVHGSIHYSWERNRLNPANNQEPYIFTYGASTEITLPWRMSLSTNIYSQNRRGYRVAGMNRNEMIWNAQIAQPLLKKKFTVALEMNDILGNLSNISRTLNDTRRSVSVSNGINSYCMLRCTYHLRTFGRR